MKYLSWVAVILGVYVIVESTGIFEDATLGSGLVLCVHKETVTLSITQSFTICNKIIVFFPRAEPPLYPVPALLCVAPA